ncbi:MAG: response regulator [Planctomycetes bacterium]|nr:response regulator [Planctomycetota bacterium]
MIATLPNPLSVLIVEDHADTAESLAELLTLCGCDVRAVGSAPAALDAAEDQMPDVVLLDIGLPGMNGWEAARWLREQAVDKQPLVVAVTGYATDADRQRSADAGIDLHLAKPADPTALILLLARIRGILSPAGSEANVLHRVAGLTRS